MTPHDPASASPPASDLPGDGRASPARPSPFLPPSDLPVVLMVTTAVVAGLVIGWGL